MCYKLYMVVTCWDVLQAVYGRWWLPVELCYKLCMVVTCGYALQAVYGGYLLKCVTSCIWATVVTCLVVLQAVYGIAIVTYVESLLFCSPHPVTALPSEPATEREDVFRFGSFTFENFAVIISLAQLTWGAGTEVQPAENIIYHSIFIIFIREKSCRLLMKICQDARCN